MKIYSVTDPEFASYGRVLPGYDTAGLLLALETVTPMPDGVEYVASQAELEALPIAGQLRDSGYGGMPIQLGWCSGHNTKLNCLEYHRSSEINIGAVEFILLLARLDELADGRLDTAKVRAFRVPAGAVVELYATTLHYAPCSASRGRGFRVAVALPRGTNGPRPEAVPLPGNPEDHLLWGRNKWLLAHPESPEAGLGAYVGLDGVNPDFAMDI
jgi:hypothetical protein